MSSRILIIDSVPTNRIVLKVKLLTAQYDVLPCATVVEARHHLTETPVDLIVLDLTQISDEIKQFCTSLRSSPETQSLPIIAIGNFDNANQRLDALRLGADEVLSKPLSDSLLQARIRSLLRAKDTDNELQLRDDTSRALGFAEPPATFARQAVIGMVGGNRPEGLALSRSLNAALNTRIRNLSADRALEESRLTPCPDLFIIDARDYNDLTDTGSLFRFVSDLRSRSESRHAAQLVITPSDQPDIAAMVLDLGSNDVVSDDASLAEIAHRVKILLARKLRTDGLRDSVQDGLRAAVMDHLTGLYNRRYVVPHLTALSERARKTEREFTVMVLDIDHFKSINDTYGHAAGDRILKGVAEVLRDNLRAIDLVARIGGEEFLVALPETSTQRAHASAERLRTMIDRTAFDIGPDLPPAHITVSIGLASSGLSCRSAEDINKLIEHADGALYRSKTKGRNQVSIGQRAA